VEGSLEPKDCPGYLRVPEDLQAVVGMDASRIAWEAAEIVVNMI